MMLKRSRLRGLPQIGKTHRRAVRLSCKMIEIFPVYADFAALVWRDRRSTALPQARPANIR
jgi:hypothetical protein